MSSYIDGISQATTASTATTTTTTSDESVMGKEDFLTLLVAQLQNQDPLNPDDPTEFTAQLAQFSSLEQLFTLNESMEALASASASSDPLSTIGQEVAYSSSSFNFEGTPVEIGYQLDSDASEVTLELQLDGTTVATLNGSDLSAGNHYLTWDGLTSSGATASSGNYTIVAQAKDASGADISISPLIKSEVTGVDLGGESGATLITKAGEITFSSIIGVYDPDSQADTEETASETEEKDSDSLAELVDSATELTETIDETNE